MNTDLKMVEETVRALRNLSVELDISVVKTNHADISRLLWRAADKINALQTQLAESQRRERAAVDDLEGAGACFTCKHFRRNGGDCFGAGKCRVDGVEIFPCNEPGVYRVEVPDDGRDTYEWRGPQEAGKERQ